MRKSIVSALEEHHHRSLVYSKDDKESKDDKGRKSAMIEPSCVNYAKIVWDVTAQNTQAPCNHEWIVLAVSLVWLAIISTIGFSRNMSGKTKAFIVGIAGNLSLIFFYAAPLSTIYLVLKSKSSSTIHPPTALLNTINGVFWTAFGIA
jgi:hypothetical protein